MNSLRNIPKLDDFLKDECIAGFKPYMSQNKINSILRFEIDKVRNKILSNTITTLDREQLYNIIAKNALIHLEGEIAERLKPVINATGIITHTNLGRAPLSRKAAEHVMQITANYNNLEYSTVTGQRRTRLCNIEKILTDLTGAEAALVVNNNAAAVFLALNSVAAGKEAILSRGEMVEIGDSFRISEIMSLSGCIIKEVGTTNKTYLDDYALALNEDTGILLKVHTSNFKVVGFASSTSPSDLVNLGRKKDIPIMEDMGSGVLIDLAKFGFNYERQVSDAVKDGVDIITFSGDKMLGGPQAGIIVGKKKYIDEMKKNQLLRCLRMDKMSLAALEATLLQYFEPELEIPVYKKMLLSANAIKEKAETLYNMLSNLEDIICEVRPHTAQFGGGSMPFEDIESYAIYIKSRKISPSKIDLYLRSLEIPVISTLQNNEIIFDLRTIEPENYEYIYMSMQSLIEKSN